ncbi:cell division protein FtsQ/DivIB [Phaeovibrio sulfidiphilus]|nr:cell division protein FtsQ/DivIB [Phaeovibrio sulfidiphilus]
MALSSISVAGRKMTPSEDIMAALGPVEGVPLLELDPVALKDRLEALPWVSLARVERRFPDRLHLSLSERTPMALWFHKGQFHVVDTEGKTVSVDVTDLAPSLPYVVGEGAPEATAGLLDLLEAAPALRERVVAATRVGERRWTLHLDTLDDGRGIQVLLPETDPAGAVARLLELDARSSLLARDVSSIDMRLSDRIVVRPRSALKKDEGTGVAPAGRAPFAPDRQPGARKSGQDA